MIIQSQTKTIQRKKKLLNYRYYLFVCMRVVKYVDHLKKFHFNFYQNLIFTWTDCFPLRYLNIDVSLFFSFNFSKFNVFFLCDFNVFRAIASNNHTICLYTIQTIHFIINFLFNALLPLFLIFFHEKEEEEEKARETYFSFFHILFVFRFRCRFLFATFHVIKTCTQQSEQNKKWIIIL